MKPLSISYRLYVPVAQLLERDPAKVEVGCESHPRDANFCKINAELRYASRFVRCNDHPVPVLKYDIAPYSHV